MWSFTTWKNFQVKYALGPYLKHTLLRELVYYIWISVLFKYGPGAYLEYSSRLSIWSWTIGRKSRNRSSRLSAVVPISIPLAFRPDSSFCCWVYYSCTNESVLPSQHDKLPVPISFFTWGGGGGTMRVKSLAQGISRPNELKSWQNPQSCDHESNTLTSAPRCPTISGP